ncbi:MafB19-like deaminase [Anaerocolumna jejuensis DSM 15929]|uniref:MafB19-like deaminase n=2 Tax=Anaerocolumna TaxID=1843210 RepID=A0A1M7DT37_9FIRM|nr:MafB19-like deaminase [Anaerocolumna jejuensis DSM 15929]
MPVAGSVDDKHTAAKLIFGDNEYYGHNGHGMQDEVKGAFSVNAQTATHAEGLAFYNAKTSGVEGTSATLITDRPACASCGYYGGIRSMAKDMGINDLTVVSPNNAPITFNPQVKPIPNPFPKPVPKTIR